MRGHGRLRPPRNYTIRLLCRSDHALHLAGTFAQATNQDHADKQLFWFWNRVQPTVLYYGRAARQLSAKQLSLHVACGCGKKFTRARTCERNFFSEVFDLQCGILSFPPGWFSTCVFQTLKIIIFQYSHKTLANRENLVKLHKKTT